MAWSELQKDLLEMIAKRLTTNVDYVRFRAVCVPWRSAVEGRPHHIPRQLPWLLQPHEGDSDIMCFYSLLEDKVYHLNVPNSREEYCCGSSQGWLALVGNGFTIRLLNPLTMDEIQLPPMTTFPEVLEFWPSEVHEEYVLVNERRFSAGIAKNIFVSKIIWSSNPSTDNCVVMAFLGHFDKLVFCRPGDNTWTVLEESIVMYDIVYYKGQFLALCYDTKLYLCDVGPSPGLHQIASLPFEQTIREHYLHMSLAEFFGKLLVAIRFFKVAPCEEFDDMSYCCVGTQFKVYMVALDSQPVEWIRVKSFGRAALFIGAINVGYQVDGIVGFEKDSIYFTVDDMEAVYQTHDSIELGIYDMKSGGITPLPCYRNSCGYVTPHPTWFTPSLC